MLKTRKKYDQLKWHCYGDGYKMWSRVNLIVLLILFTNSCQPDKPLVTNDQNNTKKSSSVLLPEPDTFNHAPQNSTFIILSGDRENDYWLMPESKAKNLQGRMQAVDSF